MKVLIVASGNSNAVSPFILDQTNVLSNKGISIEYFLVKGSGVFGYLQNITHLLKAIKKFKPNVIHAHYGLSGLLCCLQRKIPVVTTFHGSDVNVKKNRLFSKIADKLSYKSIFVSKNLSDLMNSNSFDIIPCGVDMDIFYPIEKLHARSQLNLLQNKKYVLFSSAFDNKVKNYPLAKMGIRELNDENVELIELKGYSRKQVALLMNAVDAVLMTSLSEGSPQFIKEALACNCPVVSVDVGDVNDLIHNIEGCFISSYNISEIANNLRKAIYFGRTNSRKGIEHLDNDLIGNKIINIYNNSVND